MTQLAARTRQLKRARSARQRSTAAAVSAGLVIAALVTVTPAQAIPRIWTFPGDCGTATTLQDCIANVAQPGDGLQIATDSPIPGDVNIDKTLTVTRAAGFHPTLADVLVHDATGPVMIDLSGLTMTNLSVAFGYAPGDSFSGDHLHVATQSGYAVTLAPLTVSSSVSLTSSDIVNASGGPSLGASVIDGTFTKPDLVTVRLVGNRITGDGSSYSSGILVNNDSSGGRVEATVADNDIWNINGAAVALNPAINVAFAGSGSLHADVVGNTLDRTRGIGVQVNDSAQTPGKLGVDLFDNVITRSPLGGVVVSGRNISPTLDLLAGHNDFYRDGSNVLRGKSLGSGNLAVDPGYVNEAAGNLALSKNSPVIDKGQYCPPGGIVTPDLAGHARVTGTSVDMGAYEHGATTSPQTIQLGTPGPDTLTGTAGSDVLCGYAGNDTIHAGAGNDYLDGGPGNDHLYGQAGNDTIIGGPGTDLLSGGTGNDCLNSHDGHHGNDTDNGGPGTDGAHADPGDKQLHIETHCH